MDRLLAPYIVASQSIPIVALAPLLVIWFGSGLTSKVLVCALIAFFPTLISTIVGIRNVDPDLHDLMRSLRASRRQIFRLLELPAALPVIFGGLKLSVILAVVGAVVGEFVGADVGLGFLINLARGVLDTPLMFVAIFVSLPFTTYVILAGLQSIPKDIYEAAKVDGATGWHSYRGITLPLLRPALLVASIINMINVYNSFPIIWAMTGGGPGSQTDTTTTFMYKLAFRFQDIGQSAAMAVVNFSIILLFILLYLRLVDWRRA